MSRAARRRIALASALLILLGLVACTPAPADEVETADHQVAQVRVSGSGTALPVVRILSEAFAAENPDVEFVYLPGLHSGGGVRGVANGDLEIGAVSRELSQGEQDLNLDPHPFSDDGLAVVVHPGVGVEELTTEQVQAIYRGEYDSWQELGGADIPLVVLDRNEDESAKITLREHVLGADLEIAPRAVSMFYESDMVEAVQNTPGAIGYFSLGYGLSNGVDVTYLRLDGVEPTVQAINDGAYRVLRPLGVVVSPSPDDHVSAFLEWAASDEAVELIESRGFARSQQDAE